MNHFIIKLLDLKEEEISSIDSIIEKDCSFFITLKPKLVPCKHCGTLTSKVHDYTNKTINTKVLNHSEVTILYRARRYKCIHCGKSFVEHNPFVAPNKKTSAINVFGILTDLKPYTATYSAVAKKYGVSVTTVIDLFDKHVQIDRKPLTHVLCFDEFYFNRHSKYKYAFMLLDFERKQILDIVESRRSEILTDYFFHIPLEEREKVQYICVDMYQPYIDLIRIFFKNATICIDSFHVIKKINEKLDAVRKRIMRSYAKNKQSKEYKLLKYNKKLLLKDSGDVDNEKFFSSKTLGYTTTEAGLLEAILNINEQLKIAYDLKEDYILFNQTSKSNTNIDELSEDLTELIAIMKSSKVKEFRDMSRTLNRYKMEILNSFTWFGNRRISNGPIEGKNTYIKKIISNANGLRNFDRARNKMMYSQNKDEIFSGSEHENKIKKPGKSRGKYTKKTA